MHILNDKGKAHSPNNLDGAPQIEDEEHNRLLVHFLQTSKNNEENKIPSHNLQNKIIFYHAVQSTARIFKKFQYLDYYLNKGWKNARPDNTKSSIEDLNNRQDLAEEHHIRHGVKCVIERICSEGNVQKWLT